MMRATRLLAGALAGAVLLAACGFGDPPGDAGRIDPVLAADLTPEDSAETAAAMNAFGFELLGAVTDGTDTAVVSPVSVATLLAMVAAGAGGDTGEQMAEVLGLEGTRDERVGGLLRRLADTDDVTLAVANALWAGTGTPFEDDYLGYVEDTLGATIEEADLGAQETADEIDAWVDERTEGLIEDLAEDLGLPNAQAVLVLANAVYFLGAWTEPFDPEQTRDEPFTLADGSEADVPLMQKWQEDVEYAERDGYRLVRLPYGDEERYGMEVLLPDEDVGLAELLPELDAEELREAVLALEEREIDELALPRFELEWDAELNEPLADLGMPLPFSPEADFRPMSPTDPWLDVVVHKTYVRVDEEGTEAAAVTGGVMAESAPLDPVDFRVDRPFAFTVSDSDTGAVLFLGAVADPRG